MKTKNIFKSILIPILILPVVLFLLIIYSFISCKKEISKSNAKEIISFSFTEQTDSATIDKANKQINITVKYNANLSGLIPKIVISSKATCSPVSGTKVDFTNSPVIFTVTAEDKSTQQWKVYVNKKAEGEKKILTFVLNEQSAPAVITDSTVQATVVPSSDLTKLKPVITVSSGAKINPLSGSEIDFSKGPVKFVVTASDSSTKNFMIGINRILYSGNNILSVSITGQIGVAEDSVNKIFSVSIPNGTDFTKLAPTITVSPGATISPASGQTVDFSQGPVTYTVTAENGSAATWTIKVTFPLIGASNSNIQYIGRVDFSKPTAPKFSAPGVYIKARFTGTFCSIDVNDENNMNYIEVIIDDQAPVRILVKSGRHTYSAASGLSNGEHSILICKDTEAGVGSLTFYGFICEALLPVTDMPARKIECYGNSITCGAKMLSGTPCTLTNNNTNWNAANCAYLSYGALTARALNAQWQITAVSGIGLIQSCCGMLNKMPDTYDRLDLNNSNSVKWDFTRYVPDVVTICLGQNDGSTIVASQAFINKYVAFINTLRGKYPDASIFCLTSPMADSSSSSTCLFKVMQASLTSIVDSVNSAGDSKVYWVKLPHDQNNGCTGQGHPSEAEHLKTAAVLETAIRAKMSW